VPRIDAAARHELRMQQIYVDITAPHEPPGNGLTGYLDWREIYDPLSIIFDTPQQVERYWDRFLRAYYLTTHDAGFERRETFHNDTGIPYGEMDWDLWRMMRRGTP
jgi:hypothetical protein